jgi:hypothetical protein
MRGETSRVAQSIYETQELHSLIHLDYFLYLTQQNNGFSHQSFLEEDFYLHYHLQNRSTNS